MEWFPIREGDWVSVHVETDRHIARTLARIRDLGAHPMVALNPATPLCMAEECFPLVDGVLLMTVNPGFAGQKLMEGAREKVESVRALLDANGGKEVFLEVDGNITLPNALMLSAAGADLFVLGTSGIYRGDMEANILEFQHALRESVATKS